MNITENNDKMVVDWKFDSMYCKSRSLEGNDLVTNFTAVAATINNIGPGLELVGPMENFGFLPALSKYVLMFDMLAGRLELFPLLILFHPAIWKDTFKQKIEMRKRKDRLS